MKEVLQKRLKNHIKREELTQANYSKQEMVQGDDEVHFYCVIDFEGTCEEGNPKDYVHEIIEFPAVLVDANTLEVVSAIVWQLFTLVFNLKVFEIDNHPSKDQDFVMIKTLVHTQLWRQ